MSSVSCPSAFKAKKCPPLPFIQILAGDFYSRWPTNGASSLDHISASGQSHDFYSRRRTNRASSLQRTNDFIFELYNSQVEYQEVKTEAGNVVTSKKAGSPSPTEFEEESLKKACESPGLDRQTMKAKIELWLTGLTSKMVEGLSRCESTMKTQLRMIESLTEKMG
ncbi:hypothetical protein Bca4012_037898 [Brassica carinata]